MAADFAAAGDDARGTRAPLRGGAKQNFMQSVAVIGNDVTQTRYGKYFGAYPKWQYRRASRLGRACAKFTPYLDRLKG